MKKLTLLLCVIGLSTPLFAQQQQYKVTLLRAAPGHLLELIDSIKVDIDHHESLGIEKPYLLRHSQGGQWDLMLIYPIESMEGHFALDLGNTSATIEQPYGDPIHDLISFQEEAIVKGPEQDLFEEWFEEYNLFHIEIFTALAGKQEELLKQRQMENEFYRILNHRPNLIFTRVFGPSWDNFTIGVYKDFDDYANAIQATPEEEAQAALDAGFEGINYIGSYLRELLLHHQDTFARKVQ